MIRDNHSADLTTSYLLDFTCHYFSFMSVPRFYLLDSPLKTSQFKAFRSGCHRAGQCDLLWRTKLSSAYVTWQRFTLQG